MAAKAKNNISSEHFIRSQGFTYFAFISYKREDEKWAIWLKKQLQSYRLPARTHERHSYLPERIGPVFLDKDNMTPGELGDQERREVQASKYLIVICSKNACRYSKNIDDEIQFFLDGGADASRIIPFIIDDAKDPVAQCFPARLQALCAKKNIIGANINDSGKKNAFLKLVAYMHGIQLAELLSEEQRRTKKNKILKGAIGAAAGLLVLAIGYVCWDYYVPKRYYYLDYTTVYGLPQGIGDALSEQQIRSLHHHYTIVSRYGKIQELRFENSAGTIISPIEDVHRDRPVHVKYTYSLDGTLTDETYYDIYDKPLYTGSYKNANHKVLEITRFDDGNTTSYGGGAAMKAHTVGYFDEAAENKGSNVVGYLIDYDENGFTKEIRYISNITSFGFAADADGICGIRYERDDLGRISRESYLTHTGPDMTATEPEHYCILGTRTGLAEIAHKYDGYDCIESCYYTAGGKLGSYYRNTAISRTEFQNHNPIQDHYFDENNRPALRDNAYAGLLIEYDDRGFAVKQSYLDEEEKPVFNEKEGLAITVFNYDEQGRSIEQRNYDQNEKPTLDVNGAFVYKCEYDQNGDVVRVQVFDTAEKPCLSKYGYCEERSQFDEKRNLIRLDCFDAQGNRVINTYNFASLVMEYDDEKNYALKTSYLDEKGRLYAGDDGYAGWKSEYDSRGNEKKITYFGEKEEDVKCASGYVSLERIYDEHNFLIKARYLNALGKPVVSTDGYAGWKSTFDAFGYETGVDFFGDDENESPITIPDGYASYIHEFDAYGNIITSIYLDENGDYATDSGGSSMICKEYDEKGHILKEAYYTKDDDNQLTLHVDSNIGAAYGESKYDAHGNMIEMRCYNENNAPILCAEGYAKIEKKYDKKGHIIEEAYYDTDGKSLIKKAVRGYSRLKYHYDAKGNIILIFYYDENGEKTINNDGYAEKHIKYDERSNVVRSEYYDENGDMITIHDGYAACETKYDERGYKTYECYLGTDGKPVMSENGYAVIKYEYNEAEEAVIGRGYDDKMKLVFMKAADDYVARHYPPAKAIFELSLSLIFEML